MFHSQPFATSHYRARIEPGYVDASLQYGNLLSSLQRYREALVVMETARRARPTDNDVLYSYATILRNMGELCM